MKRAIYIGPVVQTDTSYVGFGMTGFYKQFGDYDIFVSDCPDSTGFEIHLAVKMEELYFPNA